MKRYLLTFLEDTMLFIILYSITLVLLYRDNFYNGDGSLSPVYKGFMLYLFVIISGLFRKKVKKLSFFSIGHLVLILIGFLLGSSLVEKLIYAFFALTVMIFSFKTCLSETKNAYNIPFLVVGESIFYFLYLYNLYKNYTLIQPFLSIFSLVYILLFMFYMHTKNIDDSLEIIIKNSKQPVSQIKSFNRKIFAMFLFVVAVILTICSYLLNRNSIKLLVQDILTYSPFRLSFDKHEPLYQFADTLLAPVDIVNSKIPKPKFITSPVAIFLETIFKYPVNLIAVVGIISIIFYYLYLLYKKFYAHPSSANETKAFISPSLKTEKINSNFNPFKEIMHSFNTTNNEKIRKMYFKKVKQYTYLGLKVSNNTAAEISATAKTSINKDISELTTYYEKARYSNIEASKEDLINIKALETTK